MVASSLATIFPLQNGKVVQVADMVKGFDFSKMSVKDSSSIDWLHCDLAPSFGKLNSSTIQALDDEMKIMIAALTKQLGAIPPQSRTWDKIQSVCAQSPFLEAYGDGVAKADSLIKTSASVFKTNGSPDDSIVKEVSAWFTKLIGDTDVLQSTKIEIDVLGRIVAQSGATVDSFESFFAKTEKHEKTMLDIGVLRYPDIDNPYFKVYRIKLTAWSDCRRVLFTQSDQNGINGEFNSRKYKPRSSVINSLTQAAHSNAVNEANNLFS